MNSLSLASSDVETWGLGARGVTLNVESEYIPSKDLVWIIDVENNQDGSCAGIGITNDGRNFFFYSELPKHIFNGAQLVGHNIKYDVQMLRKWGFAVSPDQIVWDTQIAEYVRDSTTNTYGLKDLSYKKFGAKYPTFEELCGKGQKAISIGSLPTDIVANYNGCDVLFTWKLYQDQLAVMSAEEIRYLNEIELPTLRVLLEMEERGIGIDTAYIRGLDTRFQAEISSVVNGIRAVAGSTCNLNSHQQIKKLILEQCGISLPTTAAEELSKHQTVPLIKDILRYRTLNKLRSTYTQGLLERSDEKDKYRLHARFNQSVTHTGRLSSSQPNLQNIPTRTKEGDAIREGFVALEQGTEIVDADYSQIEPRLMAHFSNDEKLIAVFVNKEDLYDTIAKHVGCDRQTAKTLWLALSYNAGTFKIAKTAGISMNKAEEFIQRMKKAFPTFFYWKSETIAKAELEGGVGTLFGRWIPLRQEWAHLAPNYKVQGSAGEILKLALCAVRHLSPVNTVHDEILCELQASRKEEMRQAMDDIVMLKVPLICDVGTGVNWRTAKL